jgi:hypothetical protein
VTATIHTLIGRRNMAKTKTTPARNLSHLNRDRGYRFTDRDPVLELVSRVITDSGLSLAAIEAKSGVCAPTLRKWMNGVTKRPQNATVDMVLRQLGYTRHVVGPDGKVLTYG